MPVGATSLQVSAQPGVTWASAPLGKTGRLVLVIHADVVRKGTTGLRSVSYIDAHGNRQSLKV